jgi:hypothetical protein
VSRTPLLGVFFVLGTAELHEYPTATVMCDDADAAPKHIQGDNVSGNLEPLVKVTGQWAKRSANWLRRFKVFGGQSIRWRRCSVSEQKPLVSRMMASQWLKLSEPI